MVIQKDTLRYQYHMMRKEDQLQQLALRTQMAMYLEVPLYQNIMYGMIFMEKMLLNH